MKAQSCRTVDRRVTKTKAAIHDAFFTLIKTCDYNDITITALAREANIDRKTFYTHYRTLDDVVADIFSDTFQKYASEIDVEHFFDNVTENTTRAFQAINQSLEKHGLLLDAPLLNMIPIERVLRICTTCINEMLQENSQWNNASETIPLSFITEYYVGGIAALYRAWLTSDRSIDLEELSLIAANNTLYGIMGCYGSVLNINADISLSTK